MRGLNPVDYELLRCLRDRHNPDIGAHSDQSLRIIAGRLLREGRYQNGGAGDPELTPAGREALRIHEALLAAGVTL